MKTEPSPDGSTRSVPPEDASSGHSPEASSTVANEAGESSAPSNCGTRTGMRGLTSRKLTVAGLARTYLIYLPASLDPTQPIPFVFVFHGYAMSGQAMHDITQYSGVADSQGIGVAFPDGEGGADSLDDPWDVENPGQTVCGYGQDANATGDDFAFIDAMKADVTQDQCLDAEARLRDRLLDGCLLLRAHRLLPERHPRRRPSLGWHDGRPIALHDGTRSHPSLSRHVGLRDRRRVRRSDDDRRRRLSTRRDSVGAEERVRRHLFDRARERLRRQHRQCYVYDDCPSDGQVELCTFNGMDHCWAGGSTTGQADGNSCPTYRERDQPRVGLLPEVRVVASSQPI